MKFLKFAMLGGACAALSAPAFGQMGVGSDSDQFIAAVQKGDGSATTQLVADHPNIVNARDGKGDTALIIAIGRRDPEFTGFLLRKGADPNLAGAGGDTPLIKAARLGFDDAAEWLIGLNAKIDGTNRMGETPLIIAVQQRDLRMVRMLLAAGADPDVHDAAAGYSARDYAKRDPRAREILKLIDEAKPDGAATTN
jgi:ankyrin repeat protein